MKRGWKLDQILSVRFLVSIYSFKFFCKKKLYRICFFCLILFKFQYVFDLAFFIPVQSFILENDYL